MGFSKMMELLQEKNKGKIVLCNCGNFYIATGKDAIVLYKTLKVIENKKIQKYVWHFFVCMILCAKIEKMGVKKYAKKKTRIK